MRAATEWAPARKGSATAPRHPIPRGPCRTGWCLYRLSIPSASTSPWGYLQGLLEATPPPQPTPRVLRVVVAGLRGGTSQEVTWWRRCRRPWLQIAELVHVVGALKRWPCWRAPERQKCQAAGAHPPVRGTKAAGGNRPVRNTKAAGADPEPAEPPEPPEPADPPEPLAP